MRICRYDQGHTPIFTCPYHGWSYGLDGRLVGVPKYSEAYFGELDKAAWGLIPVAQLTVYRGLIWATWDPEAPSWLDYLGGMKPFLDAMLDPCDGSDGEATILLGVQKWVIPSNWKFVAENFAGDHYHNISHRSVELVGIGPGGRGDTRHGGMARPPLRGITGFPGLGHGWRGTPARPNEVGQDFYPFPRVSEPEVDRYFEAAYRRLRQSRRWPPLWLFGGGGNIFPNMAFHARFPRTILVAHPQGPTHTEMWRWYLIDQDSPEVVVDYWRRYLLRYSGPGGMTEQDDMENWNYATAASQGIIAQRYPFNYQQGLGHGQPVDDPPGAWVSEAVPSETNAWVFYERWAQLMGEPAREEDEEG